MATSTMRDVSDTSGTSWAEQQRAITTAYATETNAWNTQFFSQHVEAENVGAEPEPAQKGQTREAMRRQWKTDATSLLRHVRSDARGMDKLRRWELTVRH